MNINSNFILMGFRDTSQISNILHKIYSYKKKKCKKKKCSNWKGGKCCCN